MAIASKTELGKQVMKDRSVSLSAQQRSALILVDGKRSISEVLKMTVAVGVSAKDTEALLTMGLIEILAPTALAAVTSVTASTQVNSSSNVNAATSTSPTDAIVSSKEQFEVALNGAITVCSDLGFKGFGLNMALTGVDNMEKLQKLAPEIRRVAGEKKYAVLHPLIFGTQA